MNRILLLVLTLLISHFSSVSQPAYIKGEIPNKKNVEVKLDVMQFNPESLVLDHEQFRVRTDDHGAFEILVPKLKSAYAKCELYIDGWREQLLYLSPGDTIEGAFGGPLFESQNSFEGNAGQVANYANIYYLLFEKNITKYSLLRPRKDIIDYLEAYKQQEINLLDRYFSNGMDSSFYDFERQRINYEYLANVLKYNRRNNYVLDSTVKKSLTNFDFKNERDFVTYGEYRDIVIRSINWLFRQEIYGQPIELTNQLRLANETLTGRALSYFYVEKASALYEKARLNEAGQKILIDVVMKVAPNEDARNRLTAYFTSVKPTNYSYFTNFFTMVGSLGIVIVFFIILFLTFVFIRIRRLFKGLIALPNFNYYRLGCYVVTGIGLISALYYLYYNIPVYGVYPVFIPLLVLSFLAAQVFVFIPKFFIRGNYWLYGTLSILTTAIYIWLQLDILAELAQMAPYDYAQRGGAEIDYGIVRFLYGSIPLLLLLGFGFYYEKLLLKNQKNLSWTTKYVIEHKKFFIHFILMSLLYMPLAFNVRTPLVIGDLTFALISIAIFYLMIYYLIPKLLFQKRFLLFSMYCLGIVLSVSFVLVGLNGLSSIHALSVQGIKISYLEVFTFRDINFLHAANALILFIPAMAFVKFRQWVGEQKDKGFQLFRRKEAELQQLKSQVNPHFLFNTLNTLYAFALKEKNDKTAESIGRLANLMRFLIDDMEKERIPLESELGYIKDYIELQSVRSSVDHDIELPQSIDEEEYMIAPMLLIPFVENAFKHGINPNKKSSFIFNTKAEKGEMQFLIENTIDQDFEAFYKEKGFGIGIENVKKRLEHVYPDCHSLSIAETGNKFVVILKINTVGMLK